MEAAGLLRDPVKAVPYTIHTVLTDNGIQFTSRERDIYDSSTSSTACATSTTLSTG